MLSRNYLFPILFFALIFCFYTCAENPVTETKSSLTDQLQKVIDDARLNYNLQGISAAVFVDGHELWLGSSGRSHQIVPMSTDMLFHTGSSGKNFTAALILQLMEEHKLSLEDSLHKWLPAYVNIDSTITIKHLLNHTSGLYNFTEDPATWEAIFANPLKRWTAEEVISEFVKEPYFPPGQGWHYSNANYHLLGMIICKATGSQISAELRNRFLDPFTLDRTFFAGEEEITGTMAHNWYDYNQDGIDEDMTLIPMTSLYSFSWTSGAIVTTAEDLARWADLLYSGIILSAATLEEMLTFYPRPEPVTSGYGLGTERYELHDRIFYGHSGGGVGYTSVFMYLPQEKASFAILVNQVTDHILDIGDELSGRYINYE